MAQIKYPSTVMDRLISFYPEKRKKKGKQTHTPKSFVLPDDPNNVLSSTA